MEYFRTGVVGYSSAETPDLGASAKKANWLDEIWEQKGNWFLKGTAVPL
jgi:hypothetical protein